jgi:hypothetical protein
MAFIHSPNIVTNGLVLSLDAANPKSYGPTTVEALVVAGGGGGGMDMGGGGGGGGLLYGSSMSITAGTAYTVTVGAGGYGAPSAGGGYRTDGAGPQPTYHQFTISATAGGNSTFSSLTAVGGGYGASSYWGYTPNYGLGGSGGSGGGASGYSNGTSGSGGGAGTAGQGNRGGNVGGQYYSGGGGGAGAAGADGTNQAHGGIGVYNSILGIGYYWAGGGGGGAYSLSAGGNGGLGGAGGGAVGTTIGGAGLNNGSPGGGGSPGSQTNTPGGNAGANTGGGGGGGSHYNSNNKGGEGGSGIVVIRYAGAQKATGGTITTVGGYTIHTFTTSGTFTTGANWGDLSGNSITGTLTNGPTYSSANGGYITFDGVNDYVDTLVTKSASCTFCCWAKTTVADYRMLFNAGPSGVGPDLFFYAGNLYWNTWDGASNLFAAIPASVTDGNWHYYVVVNDGASNTKLYYDCTLLGAAAYRSAAANTNLTIGGNTESYMWTGSISSFLLYNRALTAPEILQNFNALRGRYGI